MIHKGMRITIVEWDGSTTEVEVLLFDPGMDLAIIRYEYPEETQRMSAKVLSGQVVALGPAAVQ